jgi:hypothetical protein
VVQKVVKLLTVALSAIVTSSAAIDEFFGFSDRWYSYRRSVELLKSQGWQFFQLSGAYQEYKSHEMAFPVFAERIEAIIQRDVEVYVTEGKARKGFVAEKVELPIDDVRSER